MDLSHQIFTFMNGDDRITMAAPDYHTAYSLAFEQCRQINIPLMFLGTMEWPKELIAMMPERVLH